MLKGNLIFGQSGGPTSVINASAAGVFLEALKHSDVIEKVYGAHHGIVGILTEDFFDIGEEDEKELQLLKQTPSSALGSVRYKLADVEDDDSDYWRILEVFKQYNIRYFFYNGGNDSMDTCNKISKFLQEQDYECRVIGVPKTIDNDLDGTDHCPGFGSAARYIATTMMELYLDAHVYNTGMVTVVEVMGRNAGWLAASAALAGAKGYGPDLIYLPEVTFDPEKMMSEVKRVYAEKGNAIIVISEGLKTKEGKYIPELLGEVKIDSFGHKQMGGAAAVLKSYIENNMDVKVRAIEFSLLQRCAAHVASATDVEEAFGAGSEAVKAALDGKSDIMIGFKRAKGKKYKCEFDHFPLAKVANTEKTVPLDWIINDGTYVSDKFIDYAMPLIQGDNERVQEDSLPRFAKLKKVQAGDQH